MGRTTEQNHLHDREREADAGLLGNDGHPPPQVATPVARERAAIEQNPAAPRFQRAAHETNQRRLAGSVGSDDSEKIARANFHRDLLDHGNLTVPGAHGAQLQARVAHTPKVRPPSRRRR